MGELLHNPTAGTPSRASISMRRTSHMDMIPRAVSTQQGLGLQGAARDLLTAADGGAVVLAEAQVQAELAEGRVLTSLVTDPGVSSLRALIGSPAVSGFRAKVNTAIPDHHSAHTPLFLLMDELPAAALIAGYADLYLRTPDQATNRNRDSSADICAGWARDATMMRAIARDGQVPVPLGPPAPAIELEGDAHSWHTIPPLAAGAMRRRRRIDVCVQDTVQIDAMFRDTHVDPQGTETVLHEYTVQATASLPDFEISRCQAEARVLPWVECPAAAASPERLVGRRLSELRSYVRQNLTGTSTCTHLNDLLRSLADAAPLADLLERTTHQAT